MISKAKKYKLFSFPNDLSSGEQYYYYLEEFGLIPKIFPSQIVENIFIAAANDYLEGFIDASTLELISNNLYYNHYLDPFRKDVLKIEVEDLMTQASEFTYGGKKTIQEFTMKLRTFFSK